MADLTSDFLGIKSPNPFWLASAPTRWPLRKRSLWGGMLSPRSRLPDLRTRQLPTRSISCYVVTRRTVMPVGPSKSLS